MTQPTTITHNNRTFVVNPSTATPAVTNEQVPLTCGHRHDFGDTIWTGRPDDTPGSTIAWCSACVAAAS